MKFKSAPKNRNITKHIRLTEEEWAIVTALTKKYNMTFSALVRDALEKYCEPIEV